LYWIYAVARDGGLAHQLGGGEGPAGRKGVGEHAPAAASTGRPLYDRA
jgi:hypothetical protein